MSKKKEPPPSGIPPVKDYEDSQYKKIIEELLDFSVGHDMITYINNLRFNFRSM